MATIQQINAGDNVPPKEDASKEYLAYYSQFLQSPAFKQLDPEVKQLHVLHARETMKATKGGLRDKGKKKRDKPNVMSRIVSRLRKEVIK